MMSRNIGRDKLVIKMMSVLESLSHWSLIQSDKKVWVFLSDKGDPTDSYTYKVMIVLSDADLLIYSCR